MTEDPQKNPSPDVADQNIGLLLSKAYRPEHPDPQFIKRLEDQMYAAASAPVSYRLWSAPRLISGWVAAAAAILLVGIGVLLFRGWPSSPQSGSGQRAAIPLSPRQGDSAPFAGLTPRPRAPSPAIRMLAIGESIQTKATERRRVVLPDHSVLYVNQNTTARLEADRRISVIAGEIYIEVNPSEPGQPAFTVKTPTRTVTALGTKFDIQVGKEGTGVLVTQGKVQVSGVNTPVTCGQELAPEKVKTSKAIAPAPRASQALDWTQELMAAAESPLVPDSEYQGGAIIVVDPYGQQARLSLRKFHIDVHVEDGFARTTIDQTYFNHENWRQEGTFYFPLPADASLNRLAMYVDGKLMEGGMAERDYARSVYEQILYTRRDPALLEWMDGSTFKMRVFPLEPRQEKRIIISYVQRLPEAYSQAEYRFPGGHNLELVRDWSFHATVKNAFATNWSCDTHPLLASYNGNDLSLDLSGRLIKPDRDVVIRLNGSQGSQSLADDARFSSAAQDGARYLMLRYRPNLPSEPVRQRRDWVFLFESSGNRDPLLARVQVDVIKTILENAEHDDTFNIITAATRVNTYAPDAQKAAPENMKAAIAWLERTHLVGAMDLGKALKAAEPLVQAAQNPYLVHVGTGVSALGERREDVLAQSVPQRCKYVGIGVGKQWSRAFMKTAASRTGGHFTQINPDEQITWRAFELVSTLNTPRLLDIKVAGNTGKIAFLTFADSVSQGEELAAVARIDGDTPDPQQVTIFGTLNGQPYQRNVPVANVAGNAGYLPRAWAKLEIDNLYAADANANKARIIELSKAMYVMSPFTSLLVLEDEKMYEQFKVDRGRKDHWAIYPAPAKIDVVHEPDPNMPAGAPKQVDKTAAKKPAAEQILQTILVRVPAQMMYWPNQQQYYSGQTFTAMQIYNAEYLQQIDRDGDISTWDFNGRSAGMGANRLRAFGGGGGFGGGGFSGDNRHWVTVFAKFNESELDSGLAQWGMRNGVIDAIDREATASARYRIAPSRPMAATSAPLAESAKRPMRGAVAPSLRPPFPLIREQMRGIERFDEFSGPAGNLKYDLLDGRSSLASSTDLFRMTDLLDTKEKAGLRSTIRGRGLTRDRAYVYSGNSLLYQRPYFSGNWQVFSDLLQFAPGMNTTQADIDAVLEVEAAPNALSAPGTIDPAARKLIEQARNSGWQSLTIRPGNGQAEFTITFDGAGRYAYERRVSENLREQVYCDGTTLWQLYPDLGVGAQRKVSRFHRADFAARVPFYLPSAEDLTHGCDLILVNATTVAISPHSGKPTTQPSTQPSYARIHLLFNDQSLLVERQIVEMPTGKVLYRQVLSRDGVVQLIDADGKVLQKQDSILKDAQFVTVTPDTKSLVVLSYPLRSREYVFQKHQLKPDDKRNWSEEEALAVIGADLSLNSGEMQQIVSEKFFSRGDRRIGFYTLLISGGYNWNPKNLPAFDPVQEHPTSALARYIVEQLRFTQEGQNANVSVPDQSRTSFIARLANMRYIHNRFYSGRANQGDEASRRADRQRALGFIRTCKDPQLGWAVLMLLHNYGGGYAGFYQELADVAKTFQDINGLSYAARYEYASALCSAGKSVDARKIYAELHQQALDKGVLPPIDYAFRNAFQNDDPGREQFSKMMHDASTTLIAKSGHAAGVYLAWQCYQLGEQPMAEDLLSIAMLDVPKAERLMTNLVAINYLWQTNQAPRADALIEPLLADPEYAKYPELWRLGASIAANRGMLARSLSRLERAIELDYVDLPPILNVQTVRSDYGQLLGQYEQLANAITTLEKDPPRDFLAKVIRYADRWRVLDPDDTAACQAAARILQRFDARDLAWDYLTTPLAKRPNESAGWLNLASSLRQQGDWQLADRAYATAFDVEPTNAQILWDRAQLLQQSQRIEEARQLYRQIADGQWQPRFNWIQSQARNYVRGN